MDVSVEDEDEDYDDLPIGMDIEDFLDADAAPEDEVASGFDKFLVVDNKQYMKSSVVTAMLSSKRARKVTVRTLRARGVTLEDLGRPTDSWNSTDLIDSDVIKSGDLAACLVRSGEIICLAIIEITSFEYLVDPKRQVTSIAIDEMEDLSSENRSKITVLAQVLDLKATSDFEWIWTHRYIRFESTKGPAIRERSAQHNFIIHATHSCIFPLSPSVVDTKPSGIMLPPSEKCPPLTWSLKATELEEVLDCAWLADSEEIMGNIEMIPSLGNSMLPYRKQDGESTGRQQSVVLLTGFNRPAESSSG